MNQPEFVGRKSIGSIQWEQTYTPAAYLDEGELKNEGTRFYSELDRRNRSLEVMVVTSGSLKDVPRWEALMGRSRGAFYMLESFNEFFRGELAQDSVSLLSMLRGHAVLGSLKLFADDSLTDLARFSQVKGFPSSIQGFIDYQRFEQAAEVNIEFGGVSLKDFSGAEKRRSGIPELWSFILEMSTIRRDISHRSLLVHNQGWLAAEYPNLTMTRVESLTHILDAFIGLDLEIFESMARISQADPDSAAPLKPEAYSRGLALKKGVDFVRSQAGKMILNPDLGQSDAIRAVTAPILDRDDELGFGVLALAGLETMSDIRSLYRKSIDLSEHPQYGSFYRKVRGRLEELLEFAAPYTGRLIDEELDLVLDTERINSFPRSTSIDQLGKTVGQIFSISSANRAFDLEPESLDWGLLIQPQAARIEFEASPKRFKIILNFTSMAEEERIVVLEFDTGKNSFEWSFMSLPEDPKMQVVKQAGLYIGASVLSHLHKQVTEEARIKKNTHNERPVPARQDKTKRPEDYTPEVREKQIKEIKPLGMASIMAAIAEHREELKSDQGITRHIIVPEDEALETLLGNIGENDRSRVVKKIAEFNEFGIGHFKPLETNRGGNKVFEYKVDDIRVILTLDDSSGNGAKRYNVFGIWYWKDAFKGKNRERIRQL